MTRASQPPTSSACSAWRRIRRAGTTARRFAIPPPSTAAGPPPPPSISCCGAGEVSRWHRVDAAEVWHWYAGAPLALTIADDGGPAHAPARAPTSPPASARRRSCRPRLAAGRKPRRLDAGRLHGGAGLRVLGLRDGAGRASSRRERPAGIGRSRKSLQSAAPPARRPGGTPPRVALRTFSPEADRRL